MKRSWTRSSVLSLAIATCALAHSPYKDVHGQPLKWGKAATRVQIGIHMPCTQLKYGQPVMLTLHSMNRSGQPSGIMFSLAGDFANTKVELLYAGRQVKPHSKLARNIMGMRRSDGLLRIAPNGELALGRYLKPGPYQIRVVYDPNTGRTNTAKKPVLYSNRITFDVLEPGKTVGREKWARNTLRDAPQLIQNLTHKDPLMRYSAEKQLLHMARQPYGSVILPLLEKAAVSDDGTTSKVASRILRGVLFAIVYAEERSWEWVSEHGPYLAQLGDRSWELIEEFTSADELEVLRIKAAKCSPLPLPKDLSKATPKEVGKILSELNHKDFSERIIALRSLPKTANAKIHKALIDRLTDTYSIVFPRYMGDPMPDQPVADEAEKAIHHQGKAMIPHLIAFAKSNADKWRNYRVLRLLGGLGEDKHTLAFMRDSLKSAGNESDAYWILHALGRIGPAGVPLLIETAENTKLTPHVRHIALEQLRHHGKADQLKSVIVKALKSKDQSLTDGAALTAGKVYIPATIPVMTLIAKDEKMNQNTRYLAIRAITKFTKRAEAIELLLDLIDPNVHRGVMTCAMGQLAGLGHREAIPTFVNLLDHKDWAVRSSADSALKQLTGNSEGVGFDYGFHRKTVIKAESAKWRAWLEHAPKER